MRIAILALMGVFQVTSAFADGSVFPTFGNFVGVSRLFNNDFIGDGNDRWRTGSYEVSMTFGKDVQERGMPNAPFELMQYRLRAEILAPEDLSRKKAFPDRPYAGVLGLGAFTHYQQGAYNISFGGELAMTGPGTGLGRFQTWAHDRLGVQAPQMLGRQLPNKVHPTIQGEISRDVALGQSLIRPFAEAQAGLETYARVGVDTVFGKNVSKNFFLRDPVTGHLMTNVRHSDDASFGFFMGGDVAFVQSSQLLPQHRGYTVQAMRPRARTGFVYEGENASLFYGLTWLGKEFKGQKTGQVTGSLNVKVNF
jgi:hypothetical protein